MLINRLISVRYGLFSTVVFVCSMAGCEALVGVEDTAIGRFSVRGTAVGVLEPINLQLQFEDGDEILSITADGPFEFDSTLNKGDSFSVVFLGAPECVLADPSGTVEVGDAEVGVACDGIASLTALAMSGPTAPELAFDPLELRYDASVSVLQQTTRITATPPVADVDVTVNGASVTPGQPSQDVPLGLSDTDIDIEVVHPEFGWSRSYRVTVARDAAFDQYAYGKTSNPDRDDQLGFKIAVSGDTIVVAAPFEDSAAIGVGGDQDDDSAPDGGAVYVFRRSGTAWTQEAYLKASNTEAGDLFGFSVAISGDLIAVGAPGESSAASGIGGDQMDNSAAFSGAVYVFHRSGQSWTQEAYVKASNTGTGDTFGRSVALFGDTLAVAARGEDSAATGIGGVEDDDSASTSGAVYVFRRANETWAQEAYVKASNAEAGDQFGFSVALAKDVLVVGADGESSSVSGVDNNQSNNDTADAGAAYVFRRTGDAWVQEAYLKASNTGAGDRFGVSVAVSDEFVVVGAEEEDSSGTGINGVSNESALNSGAAYVYRRSGNSWMLEAYVKPSNTGAGDLFGTSVAVGRDLLVVGSSFEDSSATGIGGDDASNGTSGSGAVYVFRRSGVTWVQHAYVKSSNPGTDDQFGASLALGADALVVGALGEASVASGVGGDQSDNSLPTSGAFYVFH